MSEILSLIAPAFDKPFPDPAFYLLLTAIGFVVGVLTGLFGVGGGFLVVPLLNITAGVPYSIAVGSSLSFIIGTGAAALPGHFRRGNVEPAAVLYMALGSAFGAVCGDVVQDFLAAAAGSDPAAFTRIMHLFFVALLLTTAWLVYRGPRRKEGAPTLLQKLPLPPRTDLSRSGLAGVSIPGLVVIGYFVGILSGLLGVGGGVLFMPILLILVGLGARQAVGTSLGVVFVSSVAGAAKKIFSAAPKVSLPVTMALLVGSSLGVQLGIRLCGVLRAEGIRKYFSLVIISAVALILADLFL